MYLTMKSLQLLLLASVPYCLAQPEEALVPCGEAFYRPSQVVLLGINTKIWLTCGSMDVLMEISSVPSWMESRR